MKTYIVDEDKLEEFQGVIINLKDKKMRRLKYEKLIDFLIDNKIDFQEV